MAAVGAGMASTRKKTPSTATRAASDPLTQFLDDEGNKRLSTAEYVAQGVERVADVHLDQIVQRLDVLAERVAKIQDSPRLQARLLALMAYLRQSADDPLASGTARKEVAFALAYFFHGGDRIPDGVPDYGLLDDALVITAVVERNQAALHEHARRFGQAWLDEI